MQTLNFFAVPVAAVLTWAVVAAGTLVTFNDFAIATEKRAPVKIERTVKAPVLISTR